MTTSFGYAEANPVQRVARRFAASPPGSWLFVRVLHRLDAPAYRLTSGRHTVSSLLSGLPVVILTTTGARSGRRRPVPVLALPVDEGLVVIASNFGQSSHPGWYHNLRARPAAEVSTPHGDLAVRAEEVTDGRRDRFWALGLAVYPGWAAYERRAADRRIAVFLLTPAGD